MKRAVALSMAMLATGAVAGKENLQLYLQRRSVHRHGGSRRWRRRPVEQDRASHSADRHRAAADIVADPDAPDADSYKNKDYEFYALKKFITLTHKNHGVVVKFYDTCRIE
jgi:hypothetical protein